MLSAPAISSRRRRAGVKTVKPEHATRLLKADARTAVWRVDPPGEPPRTVKLYALSPRMRIKHLLGRTKAQRQLRGMARLEAAGVATTGALGPVTRTRIAGRPLLRLDLPFHEGRSVWRMLREDRVPRSTAQAIGQLARQIAEQGLCHNDFKPDNLLWRASPQAPADAPGQHPQPDVARPESHAAHEQHAANEQHAARDITPPHKSLSVHARRDDPHLAAKPRGRPRPGFIRAAQPVCEDVGQGEPGEGELDTPSRHAEPRLIVLDTEGVGSSPRPGLALAFMLAKLARVCQQYQLEPQHWRVVLREALRGWPAPERRAVMRRLKRRPWRHERTRLVAGRFVTPRWRRLLKRA